MLWGVCSVALGLEPGFGFYEAQAQGPGQTSELSTLRRSGVLQVRPLLPMQHKSKSAANESPT
jgi:hypothetical protein